MVKLTKQSPVTGLNNTLEIPISQLEYETWLHSDTLIQDAFPQLTPGQREFMLTGATEEDWDKMFGDEDEPEMGVGNDSELPPF